MPKTIKQREIKHKPDEITDLSVTGESFVAALDKVSDSINGPPVFMLSGQRRMQKPQYLSIGPKL